MMAFAHDVIVSSKTDTSSKKKKKKKKLGGGHFWPFLPKIEQMKIFSKNQARKFSAVNKTPSSLST